MSALDLFASALGGFILLSIILFPYYNRDRVIVKVKGETVKVEKSKKEVEDQTTRAETTSKKLDEQIRSGAKMKATLAQCKKQENECRAELTPTFLIIGMEWAERCDIDLYVTDPAGFEFYYSRPRADRAKFPRSDGELSLDMTDGPGLEVWQSQKAAIGEYKISYRKLSCRDGSEISEVKGWVIDRSDGLRPIPTKTIREGSVEAARVRVHSDGSSAIEPR